MGYPHVTAALFVCASENSGKSVPLCTCVITTTSACGFSCRGKRYTSDVFFFTFILFPGADKDKSHYAVYLHKQMESLLYTSGKAVPGQVGEEG